MHACMFFALLGFVKRGVVESKLKQEVTKEPLRFQRLVLFSLVALHTLRIELQ